MLPCSAEFRDIQKHADHTSLLPVGKVERGASVQEVPGCSIGNGCGELSGGGAAGLDQPGVPGMKCTSLLFGKCRQFHEVCPISSCRDLPQRVSYALLQPTNLFSVSL